MILRPLVSPCDCSARFHEKNPVRWMMLNSPESYGHHSGRHRMQPNSFWNISEPEVQWEKSSWMQVHPMRGSLVWKTASLLSQGQGQGLPNLNAAQTDLSVEAQTPSSSVLSSAYIPS